MFQYSFADIGITEHCFVMRFVLLHLVPQKADIYDRYQVVIHFCIHKQARHATSSLSLTSLADPFILKNGLILLDYSSVLVSG